MYDWKIWAKIFWTVVFLVGCADTPKEGKTPAESLYKEAQELVADKRYILATEKLNSIKSQYPYSYFATHAELMLADIEYMQENYIEAAVSYQLFRDLHPKHAKIDYVIYRMADSNFKQLPSTFDRDLSSAFEAIKYFKELKEKYPHYEENDVQSKIAECEEMIKNKEKYIADFYFKTEKYLAASHRYQNIVKNYKNVELKNYAMLKVVESMHLGKDYTGCLKFSKEYGSTIDIELKEKIASIQNNCTIEYKELLTKGQEEND